MILGFDIGGTKTTILLGDLDGRVNSRLQIPTPATEPPHVALAAMATGTKTLLSDAQKQGIGTPEYVSVSVGGPLDIERGIIYSPPHLATWEAFPLKARLEAEFGLPVWVEHDGNAGALAEYYFGAGRGARNMIFITMGTGLGAGIILNGEIYHGATDAAGEVGHVRVAEDGPVEYGKAGSWEGYCSGSGIAKLAHMRAPGRWPADVSTREVVEAALAGEHAALTLMEEVGYWLGRGLAMLIDVLNPEVIVIGTLGVLLGDLLFPVARRVIAEEALPAAARACRLVPAQLGADLGDVAALMAVIHASRTKGVTATKPTS